MSAGRYQDNIETGNVVKDNQGWVNIIDSNNGIKDIGKLLEAKLTEQIQISSLRSKKIKFVNREHCLNANDSHDKEYILKQLLSEDSQDKSIFVETKEQPKKFCGTITPHSFLKKRKNAGTATDLMIPSSGRILKKTSTIREAISKITGSEKDGSEFIGSSLPIIDDQGKFCCSVTEAAIMWPVVEFILDKEPKIRDILDKIKLRDIVDGGMGLECAPNKTCTEIIDAILCKELDEDDTFYIVDEQSREFKGCISSIDLLNWEKGNPDTGAVVDRICPEWSGNFHLTPTDDLWSQATSI